MILSGKHLNQISAGNELYSEILEQQTLLEMLARYSEEMREAIEVGNNGKPRGNRTARKVQQRLELSVKGSEQLKISTENIMEQKEPRMPESPRGSLGSVEAHD